MKRRDKNELLRKMASALDAALASAEKLPKEQAAQIVGLLRECDEQMPHFVTRDNPRQYIKMLADGKIDLTVEVTR